MTRARNDRGDLCLLCVKGGGFFRQKKDGGIVFVVGECCVDNGQEVKKLSFLRVWAAPTKSEPLKAKREFCAPTATAVEHSKENFLNLLTNIVNSDKIEIINLLKEIK